MIVKRRRTKQAHDTVGWEISALPDPYREGSPAQTCARDRDDPVRLAP
jgi:hypothetical protein